MAYLKTTFRIYDGSSKTAVRIATAVTLKDGSIYQVFPEKSNFVSLDTWRSAYSTDYETRRELNSMEKRLCSWTHFERVIESPVALPEEVSETTATATATATTATATNADPGYLTRRQLGNIINITCLNPDLDSIMNKPITMRGLLNILSAISGSLEHNDFHDMDW